MYDDQDRYFDERTTWGEIPGLGEWTEIDADVTGGAQPVGLLALVAVTLDGQDERRYVVGTAGDEPGWAPAIAGLDLWEAVEDCDEDERWISFDTSEPAAALLRHYLAAQGQA